ncbi:zinc finger protein 219-like [Macrobrachium nipponense]|uniref:zinc finger protein 219-like n=1 Tax=Macrobrachium nipponense TaxID=159736 RepID=UPI0030C805C4
MEGSGTYPLLEDPGKFLQYSQDKTSHHRSLTAHGSAPLPSSATLQQHPVDRPLYAHSLLSTSGGKLISCREDNQCPRPADKSLDTLPHHHNQFLEFPPIPTQSFTHQSPHHEPQSFEVVSQCLNVQPLETILPPGKYQQAKSSSEDKMFDCPYCNAGFKGRMAIEKHDGREGTEAHLRSVGHHDLDRSVLLGSDQQGPENVGLPVTESVYGATNLLTRKIDEGSVNPPVLVQGESRGHYQKGSPDATQKSGPRDSRKGEFSQTVSSDLDVFGTSESSDDIIFEGSTLGDSSQELTVLGANPLSSVAGSSSQQASTGTSEPADERLPGSDYSATDQQQWKQLFGYDASTSRYVCQWCGRNFDRISNLKRHVLLHSGIKPFKCLYCNYRATQKANVVQHVASRHRDEMRALLNNNINVNDMLVPTPGMKS